MIEAVVGGEKVWVAFEHKPTMAGVTVGGHLYVGVTACHLYTGGPKKEERREIGRGEAHCSEQDNFCKEKGRKGALRRALEVAFPGGEGREARAAVWKAYRGRG